ncbi:MAG: RNA 2',3'-cyclic phosphodiesterase [Firmicutes bacterium]|nr:RNA 2',3'-cyclic phosphodiesterase [Bacillota bacterium]
MRLFIAINFDDKTKARLLQCQESLRQASVDGNFTRPENLHLTLVFLGEAPPGRVPEIQRVMESAPAGPFSLQFEGIGKFGDTWWVGIRQNPMLTGLYDHLSQGLKAAGFSIESRPFKPHLTLAREVILRPGASLEKSAPFVTQVAAIHLMKSERINGKLTYTSIYEKKL